MPELQAFIFMGLTSPKEKSDVIPSTAGENRLRMNTIATFLQVSCESLRVPPNSLEPSISTVRLAGENA